MLFYFGEGECESMKILHRVFYASILPSYNRNLVRFSLKLNTYKSRAEHRENTSIEKLLKMILQYIFKIDCDHFLEK